MPTKQIQALIIAATKWSCAYHNLKKWGYNRQQINYIEEYSKENKMVSGHVEYLEYILWNTFCGINLVEYIEEKWYE
jgi:hypothetical protein